MTLNDHIYRLTNELWDIHLMLVRRIDPEPLDPDLLRGLRAAADYVRHSLWVRDGDERGLLARTVQQALLTHRLQRASEMLESALSQSQSLQFTREDGALLERIRSLGSAFETDKGESR